MPVHIKAQTAAQQMARQTARNERRQIDGLPPMAFTVLNEIADAIDAGTTSQLHARWLRNIAHTTSIRYERGAR